MMSRAFQVCGLLCAAVATSAAWAQEIQPAPPANLASADAGIPPAAVATSGETIVRGDWDRTATTWRISGEELRRRGAETLADALELLPHGRVRLGGRGGERFDLRGARPGSIRVLVDGVVMEDPYLGRFDPSSLPVTDVIEIRVNASPLSPMDGMGGGGGWIEVETLSGLGPSYLEGRARLGAPLDGLVAASARHPVGDHAGVRLSGAARLGRPAFGLNHPDGSQTSFQTEAVLASAGARLDAKLQHWDLKADFGFVHRCFWVPPGEEVDPLLQHVCPQQSIRGVASAQRAAETWSASLTAYGLLLARMTEFLADPVATTTASTESVGAQRGGIATLFGMTLTPSVRTLFGLRVDAEAAAVQSSSLGGSTGAAATSEPAVAIAYADGPLRGEVSGGFTIPLSPASPWWPEGKVQLEWRPQRGLFLAATGARKGRLPTLRERFGLVVSNPQLGPELHTYADLEVRWNGPWLSPRASVFYRWMDGLIQLNSARTSLVNLEHITARGVELDLAVNPTGILGGGVAYGYISSTTPIENQPTHHGDVYARLTLLHGGGTLRLQYVGARPESGTILEPYAVIDASAWVQPTPNVRLVARVDNLLDVRFQHRSTLLSSGRWIGLSAEIVLQ